MPKAPSNCSALHLNSPQDWVWTDQAAISAEALASPINIGTIEANLELPVEETSCPDAFESRSMFDTMDHDMLSNVGSYQCLPIIEDYNCISKPGPEPVAVVEPSSDLDDEPAHATSEMIPCSPDGKHYTVGRLLDRWKGRFCVKLFNGSCSWEPRKNILDSGLIEDLERNHGGLHLGMEVIRPGSTRGRKTEYRVHLKGRPEKEDTWVAEKYMSLELIMLHAQDPGRAAGHGIDQ
ncbi:hypothetical protein QBC36DRAFT_378420 [Triangularia setosa]|uniref:Chromo domain-containing protein n=1 Tax=Triangularia setosa TaxID=2587417 RepID=A0AAN6W7M5_9PEZI|nr:hypothetical protein QBC36DRAFT_378420 [Podospora setosa]